MESLFQVLPFVVRTLKDSSLSKERNRIFSWSEATISNTAFLMVMFALVIAPRHPTPPSYPTIFTTFSARVSIFFSTLNNRGLTFSSCARTNCTKSGRGPWLANLPAVTELRPLSGLVKP
jgi:hypothetical protein